MIQTHEACLLFIFLIKHTHVKYGNEWDLLCHIQTCTLSAMTRRTTLYPVHLTICCFHPAHIAMASSVHALHSDPSKLISVYVKEHMTWGSGLFPLMEYIHTAWFFFLKMAAFHYFFMISDEYFINIYVPYFLYASMCWWQLSICALCLLYLNRWLYATILNYNCQHDCNKT